MTTQLDDPAIGRNEGGETHRAVVGRRDREHYVRRWVNTWVALGAIVVLVVIGYLVFISSSLGKINNDLGIAQDAVVNSEGNMKTLPSQLSAVNSNLKQINTSLAHVPEYATQIRSNLKAVEATSGSTSTSLADASPQLDTVSDDLTKASSTLGPVASRLTTTSTLLTQILSGTSSIDTDLKAINGSSSQAGIRGLANGVESISSSLGGAEADLRNVLGRVQSINGHLYRVCKSAPINLLHGPQPC